MNKRMNPLALTVTIALTVLAIAVIMIGGIAGNYLMTIHYVDTLTAKQQHAQAAQSVKLCKSIYQMDQAGHGAKFATTDAEQYGHKLSEAIHQLYISSECDQVLNKK